MPIEIMDRYTRALIQASPNKLFVFGDNEARSGLGGQAREARGEPNTVGVRTKRRPSNDDDSFWSDLDFPGNALMVLEDFRAVINVLEFGGVVVWPRDGVGTGLSRLAEKAPLTLHFMNTVFNSLVKKHGTTDKRERGWPCRTV